MAITKLESSRDFFRIWFFWKKQAVLVLLLIIGLTMFYAYTATPLYESSASILVQPKTNEGEVISNGIDTKRIVPVTTQDIYTEMELIESDQVLQSTIQSFGDKGMTLNVDDKTFVSSIFSSLNNAFNSVIVALKLKSSFSSKISSQIAMLKGALIIKPVVDSDVITVALRAENPKEAVLVIARLLKFYLQHRNNVYTKKAGLKFYDERTADYRNKLDKAEEKVKEFQNSWSIVNMRGQNEANIALLAKLTDDLKMQEISYTGARSRISMLKTKLLDDPKGLYLTKDMRRIPAIVELEKGIVPLLVERSKISRNFTPTSREYQSINGQVTMLRKEIRRRLRRLSKLMKLKQKVSRFKLIHSTKRLLFYGVTPMRSARNKKNS